MLFKKSPTSQKLLCCIIGEKLIKVSTMENAPIIVRVWCGGICIFRVFIMITKDWKYGDVREYRAEMLGDVPDVLYHLLDVQCTVINMWHTVPKESQKCWEKQLVFSGLQFLINT